MDTKRYDTVQIRLQLVVNDFYGRAFQDSTFQPELLAQLNREIPEYVAKDFSIDEDEVLNGHGAIRILCNIRGRQASYELAPHNVDRHNIMLPPLTVEELAERTRLHPPLPPAKVVLIAARTPAGVIGMSGGLPWMIREDLQHFKVSTMNKALIVGRTTYQSMPEIVWKTRIAHVLTRDSRRIAKPPSEYHFAGCLAGLVNSARHNYAAPGEVYIGGGAEVYALALQLGLVDEMLISEIHQHYIGDVYFPPVPEGMFDEGTVEAEYAEFNVVRYRRLVAN